MHGIRLVFAAFVVSAAAHAAGENADVSDQATAFLADCAKQSAAAETMTVVGKDGWLFFKGELHHVGAGEFWGPAAAKVAAAPLANAKDPLPAILHYKDQLAAAGIELILVPVPPKAVIFPDKVSDTVTVPAGQAPPRLDPYHQAFYRLLAEKGVKVIDLIPDFLAHRQDGGDPLYCRTDTHWSGVGCIRAARIVADELRSRPWFKDVATTRFDTEDRTITITGDLAAAAKDAKPGPESLRLRFVGKRTAGGFELLKPNPDSPILVLSDSHGLVFHVGDDLFAKGAGFPDQLAAELGVVPDEIGSRGDGVTKVRIDLYQRAKVDPAWLAKKKVVLWLFSAREFTENTNGWRQVPVKR